MADISGRGRPPSLQQGEAKRSRVTSYELARKPPRLGGRGYPVNLRANYFAIMKLPPVSARLYEVRSFEFLPFQLRLGQESFLQKRVCQKWAIAAVH